MSVLGSGSSLHYAELVMALSFLSQHPAWGDSVLIYLNEALLGDEGYGTWVLTPTPGLGTLCTASIVVVSSLLTHAPLVAYGTLTSKYTYPVLTSSFLLCQPEWVEDSEEDDRSCVVS